MNCKDVPLSSKLDRQRIGGVEQRGLAAAPRTREAPKTETDQVAPLSGIGEFEALSSPSVIGRVDV